MNTKAKGTRAERDLIHKFHAQGWSCIRTAGSGSMKYPAPDILAGNAIRRLAIECKVTKEKKKYFQRAEIEQLNDFSRNFGAEAWIGVKFAQEDWLFVMLEDLEETGKCMAVSLELALRRGLSVQELLKTDTNI